METGILISNLTNPTLLFFLLGIIAAVIKSDLEVPANASKFIALYLLFAIGFKGGQELSHSEFNAEIVYTLIAAVVISALIPLYSYFILRTKLNVYDAGAVAATYGSVSAVTFVAATGFLEMQGIDFGGHMVAAMALMESPAIIVGVILIIIYNKDKNEKHDFGSALHHSFTNGSVIMIVGSLLIGYFADTKQAEGIRPFTTDIFKGFLAVFLLDMGMTTAKRFSAFIKYGRFVTAFAIIMPIINGCIFGYLSGYFIEDIGNRFLFAILSASASYIAVPAAMRLAVPKADPGLYLPMALGLTFPINITVGMPLYYWVCGLV